MSESKPVPTAAPDILERARRYPEKIGPAVSGQGGHNRTFDAACSLVRGFNLDRQSAWMLLQEYNQRCQPPWSDRELAHKLDDAIEKASGEPGYLSREREERPVEHATDPKPGPQPEHVPDANAAEPWPRLYHNMRASRQTELSAEHPLHVVCEWLGNSAAVAANHYLTVREEDFAKATAGCAAFCAATTGESLGSTGVVALHENEKTPGKTGFPGVLRHPLGEKNNRLFPRKTRGISRGVVQEVVQQK